MKYLQRSDGVIFTWSASLALKPNFVVIETEEPEFPPEEIGTAKKAILMLEKKHALEKEFEVPKEPLQPEEHIQTPSLRGRKAKK